jgi:hypothetical protein
MDVTSTCDPVAFAERVLQGISASDYLADGEDDLCFELGLSIWMRQTHTGVDDALPALLAMRSALLETSGMDLATEPIPLRGIDPRMDLLTLGRYLSHLVARVTVRAHGDATLMVERALGYLQSGRHDPAGSALALG